MTWEMCERFGFNAAEIAQRVRLVELGGDDNRRLGRLLQEQVVADRSDAIVDGFMQSLQRVDDFHALVNQHSDFDRLGALQRRYLEAFGIDVETFGYFEQRLRIGRIHHRIGVPQPVYLSAFHALEHQLIRNISRDLRADSATYDALVGFILKVTALDMSLAVESYCKSQTCSLMDTLESERGETERLRRMSITDWLTDLHNHAYSRHLLADKLAEATASGAPLCVVMADLDRFKEINDTYGHLVGDHVLRIAAARMVSAARSGDEIGRYGGEEFLFVLENTDLEEAAEVAERVRTRIDADDIRHRQASISTSMSFGIAQARAGDSVDDLIERADDALYAAKLAGRNCTMIAKAG